MSTDGTVVEPLHHLSRPSPELVDISALGSRLDIVQVLICEGRAHVFKVSIPIIHVKEFSAVLTVKRLNALGLRIPYDFFGWSKRVPR
jgi:hypothetical protein